MALTSCPECSGKVSDKAYSCPHCGFPMQSAPAPVKIIKKKRMRRANGTGTIVKLSGHRRKPFQVRVNTRIDDFGMPIYTILGHFPDRVSADIALAEYNKNPYDPENRKKTFQETFENWYMWKYKIPVTVKETKTSSQYCCISAFKKCECLHSIPMWDIRSQDMQNILDREELSHATLEHIQNLFKQMYKYSLQYEMVPKDYSQFTKINKKDDDKHGIPFSESELKSLWQHKEITFVDTILILCYSGWRINELATMPLENINLQEGTFTGGLKNRYSRNRIVPIHSAIFPLVQNRYQKNFKSLIYHDGSKNIQEAVYRESFRSALLSCGIQTKHTPHDCRHTFNVLLDNAGVDRVTRYILMGHKGKDINETVYTHKNINQLKKSIEMIKI